MSAIVQYLGDDLPSSLIDQVRELETTVDALNRRVSQLSKDRSLKRSKVGRVLEARLTGSNLA